MVFVKAQMFKHYDAVARALSQSLSIAVNSQC